MSFFSRIQTVDLHALDWTYKHLRCRVGDIVMPLISRLGNLGIVWFALMGVLFFSRKNVEAAYAAFLSILCSTLIANFLLKNTVRRPRPFDVREGVDTIIAEPEDFSFPSGHTCSSFAVASAIYCYLPALGVYAVAMAFLIALSRLYLCVHYLSDVLFSVVLGIGIASGVQYFLHFSFFSSGLALLSSALLR